ncbi:hypothetical protein BVRB_016670 [Beta vulgaris subsp. vulgaris]|uniref:Uncharacterized protein n=1 Tax=Beta vulgaris subsp. vulgaris TaxID=3555 RepID=A0A0J8B0X8_BETVV|nr:F-box/kelch-repeat protein KIB1 [Beta vulgaris subsp. vulgaris]XP_048495136.1 F-box/kelch-repeat protein KIB1 [Beta vulgaris subsp. vulgaris]KMS94646.1 hypothetical protein BVRB_016670 [Beta vulgaris subsp. vulgaris]
MSDWSMLPDELLGIIACKLDSAEDLISFSVVCHSWHYVYSTYKTDWTPKMPWLMLSENIDDNPDYSRKFFCPTKEKYYQIKVPQTFGARCWGSSCGWIVTLHLSLEMYLFNPLTRAQFPLPSFLTLSHQPEDEELDPLWLRQMWVENLFVFADQNGDFIVIVIYGCWRGFIAYARPSDQTWIPFLDITLRERFLRAQDVTCCRSKIIILYDQGVLGIAEMSAFQNSQPVFVSIYNAVPTKDFSLSQFYGQIYLLESYGDLFLVLRHKDLIEGDLWYETCYFEVHKFDFDGTRWEDFKDIGDLSLFVGNDCAMSVRASLTKNCKSNCIYFTDDEFQFWDIAKRYGGHDMGIYYLVNKEIENVYEGNDTRSTFCPPLLFMPKF